MPEKKAPVGLLAVDPEAQRYVREVTQPFVVEMVHTLVEIARDKEAGKRDRMKCAVRVIDYYARGGSATDVQANGQPSVGIVVINGENMRDQDLAADQLRQLMKATSVQTKQ
jgi:hypothetical protein